LTSFSIAANRDGAFGRSLRAEDGTILRSRFPLAWHYWMKSAAAWQ
jgi:hypothetical protein